MASLFSEDKHIFLCIVKPKDKLVISAREEFIPKKDKNGCWIDFPANNSKLQFITPNVEYVPTYITIEDVISIIQKKVRFQINHANRFSEEYAGNLSKNEFEELTNKEIKTYANDINRAS